jgi:hypothetical protein
MTFQHPDLEQFYERVMALKVGGLTDEERPVFALMDAYGWFRLIDGDQTATIQEIISLLLSPELRPGLRSWYRRHATTATNSVFTEFRDRLGKIAGESFV